MGRRKERAPVAVVGFDVGKSFHWAFGVGAGGEAVLSERVDNRPAAIDRILAEAGADALVVVDQRRNIGSLVLSRARAAGMRVAYLPGKAEKRAREMFPATAKTDELDAEVIARTALGMPWTLREVPEEDERRASLRMLSSQRSFCVKGRTESLNRLRAVLLEADPALTRPRRLSPAEAWARREGDVIRAERACMPLILGEGLAMRATVSAKLELKVKDPAIDFAATVAGVVQTPEGEERLLRRGQEALVWVNPLEPLLAYVAEPAKDGSWRYLGTAPVLAPSHQDDPEGVAANLKIRAKIQALERRGLLPWAEQRAAARQADVAHNARLIALAQVDGSAAAPPDGSRFSVRPFGAPNQPITKNRKPTTAGAGLSGATMDDLI